MAQIVAEPSSQFWAFHQANPQVYKNLERLTQELWMRGRTRIGMKMLFEVLRWEHYMNTADEHSSYKLNNNYTAYYSRLLTERHPEWDGLFETRRMNEPVHA